MVCNARCDKTNSVHSNADNNADKHHHLRLRLMAEVSVFGAIFSGLDRRFEEKSAVGAEDMREGRVRDRRLLWEDVKSCVKPGA